MKIERVTVLGAGTMGRGIAHVAAQSGYRATLRDVSEPVLVQALGAIRATLGKGVEKGKVGAEDRDATLARLRTETDLGRALSGADMVVEAVPEDLALKRKVFADVEAHAPAHAVLATNTSSLSVTQIAQAVRTPDRVVGMHFFNPVHLLPLVEVVRGQATRDDVVDAAVETARRMGKEPIVVRDSPGFASSRLGVALGLEAVRMLEEGVAAAEDIDKAMELGYRHPMGPLKLTDLVGLDVRLAIAEHLHRALGRDAFKPPELLKRMVAEGHLGRKTGRGFYAYPSRPD